MRCLFNKILPYLQARLSLREPNNLDTNTRVLPSENVMKEKQWFVYKCRITTGIISGKDSSIQLDLSMKKSKLYENLLRKFASTLYS